MVDSAPDPAATGKSLRILLGRVLWFAYRVVREFMANRGLLLAGGVGYNLLLSIVPLFIVLGVVLSRLVSEGQLLGTLRAQLGIFAPGHADAVLEIVAPLLRSPEGIGLIGFLILLFFSSLAFRMLEDAIAIIFGIHRQPRRRSVWFSTLAPYAFVVVLGAGLLALTLLVTLANALAGQEVTVQGVDVALSTSARILAYALGFVGLGLLFTALYKLLPELHISPRRALVGGFVAAALWEGVLQTLVWYFEEVSMVDTVYGPFASVVVILLALEAGAAILLLGAQVIAELEYSAARGIPWWETRAPAAVRLEQPDGST